MRYELLMEVLNRKMFLELLLTEAVYFFCWFLFFKLGYVILKENFMSKGIAIIGPLTSSLSCLLVKPFLPMPIGFVFPAVILVTFLKLDGKKDLLSSIWATLLVYICIVAGIIFIASPLCLNKDIASFFFNTIYGDIVGTLVEAICPAITIFILSKNPKISLLPPFLNKKFDVVAVVTLGATFYFIYCQSLRLLESIKSNSDQKIEHFFYEWLATLTAVAGYYSLYNKTKKENIRLELENMKYAEFQATITEKNQQITELFETIRILMKDQESRGIIPDETNMPEESIAEITEREKKFIQYLIQGLTYKEIGAIEKLSLSRVGDIFDDIKKKLNVKSQAQIPIIALKNKIIE